MLCIVLYYKFFKYANEALSNEMCTNLLHFANKESELWIKSGSNIFSMQYIFLSIYKSENIVNSQKKTLYFYK